MWAPPWSWRRKSRWVWVRGPPGGRGMRSGPEACRTARSGLVMHRSGSPRVAGTDGQDASALHPDLDDRLARLGGEGSEPCAGAEEDAFLLGRVQRVLPVRRPRIVLPFCLRSRDDPGAEAREDVAAVRR